MTDMQYHLRGPVLTAALPALLIFLSGCVSRVGGPLPDPLPETLAWAAESQGASPSDPLGRNSGAFLGLTGRENTSGSLESLSFSPGMRVTKVVDGSPAQGAGFRIGDVLLRVGEVAIDGPETLQAVLESTAPGEEVTLVAQRGDSGFEVPVSLRDRAESAANTAELVWRSDPARSRANWLTGRGSVVLVSSEEQGPFPRAGVAVGSVVVALDDEPMRSARGLIRKLQALPAGERVKVEYLAPDNSELQRARVKLFAPGRRVTEASLPVLAGYRSSVDGETRSFYLLDLYFISLLRYRRDGAEKELRILRFIRFASGAGELTEVAR